MSDDEIGGATALVTGASRGFGRGIATALSRAGAQVVGVARIWRGSPVCAADDLAVGARRSETRARPWRQRLRALLNAQALIRGATGGPDEIAFAEDDRQRLARRGN